MADYYQLLGIPSNASFAEIKAAYRKQAKKYHPDVNKSPNAQYQFVLLTTAYQTLIDSHKRTAYDNSKQQKASTASFQTYQEWAQAKKAQAEWEAKMRYYEFLKKREAFRQSKYYKLAIWITYFMKNIAYLFGLGVIGVSLYLIYNIHFMLIFLLLPFICGGVYIIKWTNDWYKETRRYF